MINYGNKAKNLSILQKIVPDSVPTFCVVTNENNEEYEKVALIIPEDSKVAFRSSANLEDGKQLSFAGMFDSYTNITFNRENFKKYVIKCKNSNLNNRLNKYLDNHGIKSSKIKIAVIIQQMFDAEYSGVCFKSIEGKSFISIGKQNDVVNGENCREIEIDHQVLTNLPQSIPKKVWMKLLHSFDLIVEQYKSPQDIEWAVNKNSIGILQTRPITKSIDVSDDTQTWDATNIGENYPGVTLPLTFSFIRKAYSCVYQNFLKFLGVGSNVINEHEYIFNNMLGYINAHVYYNINNWYGLLRLLPFYETNKEFFDNMLVPVKKNSEKIKYKFGFNFVVAYRFIFKILFPHRSFRVFNKEYKSIKNEYDSSDLRNLTTVEITKLFDSIANKFFGIWGITIINDFRTMIFFGLLTKLARRWISRPDEYINSIIKNDTYPESIKPLKKLYYIAKIINSDTNYSNLFHNTPKQIWQSLSEARYSEIRQLIDSYLEEYGERSANELKLEEPKLNESPDNLIKLIKNYLLSGKKNFISVSATKSNYSLVLPFIYKIIIKSLEKITLDSIYKREEFRLKRGKVFGIAREIFLELGNRFTTNKTINDKNDIFYLEKDEIWNIICFQSLPKNLVEIIKMRKVFIDSQRNTDLPIRVNSNGYLTTNSIFVPDMNKNPQSVLKGKATSKVSNHVIGEVVVMKEFSFNVDVQNKILVTPKIDPGWTILFPLIKGIVTEKGNTLSHASIIARELNIPCIVGLEDATNIFKNGDTVILNTDLSEVSLVKQNK